MILGIGIDVVEAERFNPWLTYTHERLNKVFTDQELVDCRNAEGTLIAEKLAVRYAAKEAFYKALSGALIKANSTQIVATRLLYKEFSFLQLASHCHVQYGTWGVPILVVEWDAVEELSGSHVPLVMKAHLSLSHERTMAVAMVVIEN